MTSSHNMWQYSSNDLPQIFTLKIYIPYGRVYPHERHNCFHGYSMRSVRRCHVSPTHPR